MTDTLTDLIRTLNLTFGPLRPAPKWPGPRVRRRLPAAFMMTDSARLADPAALVSKLSPAIGIIVRHYDHPDRTAFTCDLVHKAHRRGIIVLVAGDMTIARRAGADGIHLPGHQARAGRRSGHRPAHWLVTAAAHDRTELSGAKTVRADAVLVSPVFPTSTRLQRRALGLFGLRRLARAAKVPIYALGGLNPARIRRLGVGAAGFAGIGEFVGLGNR